MNKEKLLLRALQAATFLVLAVLAVFILRVTGVISGPAINPRGQQTENRQKTKVRRPTASKNASFQELISGADNAVYLGRLSEALELYKKASEKEPQEFLPYEKIGDIYFLQRNFDSALQNYRLAQTLALQNPFIATKIIRGMLSARKILEAKARTEQISPATQESLYYLGLIHSYLNEQDKAKDYLTQSLVIGNNEQLKTYAQRILTAYRDFELAKDSPIEYLQVMLAKIMNLNGEYGLAIELAFGAIKNKHDYRDAWLVLGHAFLNQNSWPDAEDAFTKTIELDGLSSTAHFFRGAALRWQRKLADSNADLKRALELNWQPRILANKYLADNFYDMNDYQQAFNYYKEVALTDSTDIAVFLKPISIAIEKINRPADAWKLAQKAYEAHPDNADAHNLLGWAAMANNDLPFARRHLEEAVKSNPGLSFAYLNLGRLLELEGSGQSALNNYKKAHELANETGEDDISQEAARRFNDLSNRIPQIQTGSSTTPQNAPPPTPVQESPTIQPSQNIQPAPPAAPQSQPQPTQGPQFIPSLSLS